jgi:hypothetical protein
MYCGLPFTTAACLHIKIDKIFTQCFLAFDFKLHLCRFQITILPPPIDESLYFAATPDTIVDTPWGFIFAEMTRSKPPHYLLPNLLQHCQNRHLPRNEKLGVKDFRNIGSEMAVSFASEVQICPDRASSRVGPSLGQTRLGSSDFNPARLD